jgi:hypothetical protein
MTGRPSVNTRQRELLRKERQADKIVKRDERRAKRNEEPGAVPLDGELIEGLELAQPGAEPAQQDIDSAQPGAEPAQPGAEPAQPGAEPAQRAVVAPPAAAPPAAAPPVAAPPAAARATK